MSMKQQRKPTAKNGSITSSVKQKGRSSWKTEKVMHVLAFILAALCGYLHYQHVSTLNENHVHFSHLSTLERELFFRTEMGFYYSYYKQMVEAETFSSGIALLLNDNITEYPTAINALGRFNLYPEVILSAAYRIYVDAMETRRGLPTRTCYRINRGDEAPPMTSCVGLGVPEIFYTQTVFVLAGFCVAGFFLLAYTICFNSISAGLLAVAAFFLNHSECTRVMWTPPLRESFSYPFLVWQNLAVVLSMRQPRSWRCFSLLLGTTLLFLLPWQFAQFVLVLQSCALFGCHLFRFLDSSTLRRLLTCILAAGVLSSVLQFGNTMLITGIFPAAILSMVALSFCRLDRRIDSLFGRMVISGFLLAGLTFATKLLLSMSSSEQDDNHIWELLRSKFDSRFDTFDTKLYTCSPEFGFYQLSSVIQLTKTLVLPTAIASTGIVLWTFCRCRGRLSLQESATFTFVLLQVAAMGMLAGLIMRLKLLFTPQLILTAVLVFHEKLCPTRHINALALALLVGMAFNGVPLLQKERAIVGEYSNYGLEQVVDWILKNTEPSDSFVGPMTIMATVRETTFRPVYNHPHYEDAALRNRTRHAYSIYSRKPLDEIWRIHKHQIGTKYVLAEKKMCSSKRATGCQYREIWDVEDHANVGNEPVCERLFQENGELDPYFRKVYENREFTILEVMEETLGAIASQDSKSCPSPLPPQRKYLLYKVQSAEGFNVQRNVFMRVAQLVMGLEDSQDYTIVLPPFANSIHWSDRSTHPFGTFFDLEILREAVNVIELEEFLALSEGAVDTLVHLSAKDDIRAEEVVSRQPECSGEIVNADNSAWNTEIKLRSVETESSFVSYEGTMLGHSFSVENLDCLKVRFDLKGSNLAPTLSDIFNHSSSVLIDNAEKISWDIGQGEGSPVYYDLLAKLRFPQRLHNVALDFMSSRNFAPDFVAVHMRRKDFLHARPDVPSPAEVGVQLAVIAKDISLSRAPDLSSTKKNQIISVFVATDSTQLDQDILELKESLLAAVEVNGDASLEIDVVSFPGDISFEQGEVALIDQIISTCASHFVGSNSSYFTKTVFEERMLIGKSIPSTYSVLCRAGSNSNQPCRSDLNSCISCMNSWLPNLSAKMLSVLSEVRLRDKKGLSERYQCDFGQPTDHGTNNTSNVPDEAICFVIMSQYGSKKDEAASDSIRSRLEVDGHSVLALHEDFSVEEVQQGLWTILPLLSSLADGGCGSSRAHSWYIFIPPHADADFDGVAKALETLHASQPQFVGRAYHDSVPSICHHYSSDFSLEYPLLDTGFGVTRSLLHRLLQPVDTRRSFHIDPMFELAKHIKGSAGVSLTDIPLFEVEKRNHEKFQDWDNYPSPQSIFIAVKTTLDNHATRVPVVKKVWANAAERSGARVIFYSETEDPAIPTCTVDGEIANSREIKGEAKKLITIFKHVSKAFEDAKVHKGEISFDWLVVADDDTLLNMIELRRVLADYDPSVPLLLGERYAYGHGMRGGYDYLTGGGGFISSSSALDLVAKSLEGKYPTTDQPDDMWLGRFAKSLGIPLINEPGFHQGRPADYNPQSLSLHRHVSFHRFKDMKEALDISERYLTQ